ncbi:MAG TPA: type 1 glutamine amidotransferase-like domain-containing protein, partial [Acholeplasmataceae bacterium]|nr:type 1 glutamine amidotransferase-like domain-containing protein [Acholeplasmataceae bacterium]
MIITIGGGEINTGETRKIDQFIVDAAKKENPKLLFIPTASNDAPGY